MAPVKHHINLYHPWRSHYFLPLGRDSTLMWIQGLSSFPNVWASGLYLSKKKRMFDFLSILACTTLLSQKSTLILCVPDCMWMLCASIVSSYDPHQGHIATFHLASSSYFSLLLCWMHLKFDWEMQWKSEIHVHVFAVKWELLRK